jgi:hypothetical protein
LALPPALQAVRDELDGRNRFTQLSPSTSRRLLEPICAALADWGAKTAKVDYSGSGGDVSVDTVIAEPPGVRLDPELRDLIESWALAVLPVGWAQDDGGEGAVLIAVATASAHIEHTDFYMASEEHPFDIGDFPRPTGGEAPGATDGGTAP